MEMLELSLPSSLNNGGNIAVSASESGSESELEGTQIVSVTGSSTSEQPESGYIRIF